MRPTLSRLLASLMFFTASSAAFVACSAGSTSTGDKAGGDEGAGGGGGGAGGGQGGAAGSKGLCNTCIGSVFKGCDEAGYVKPDEDCSLQNKVCSSIGCTTCVPGMVSCVGNERRQCDAKGEPGEVVEACDTSKGFVCRDGLCSSGCQLSDAQPSNVGCEFWAVDLDNEPNTGLTNAANEPWGLVLSNGGDATANVTIEQNDAPLGQPPKLTVVAQQTIAPGQLVGIKMPTRELDGGSSPGADGAPGTHLSSNAFRVTSSSPIIVYQFNTVTNSFSNDASLLLPKNALGTSYRALGYPTANPIEAGPPLPHVPGIPDRTYVTVVGTTPNTQVKVKPSWRLHKSDNVPEPGPDGYYVVTLGPFDVLNLETDDATLADLTSGQRITDLTGTTVESSAPVAVFVGNERASAPGNDVPPPPSGSQGCCTDHLEEQLFPLTSIGKKFVLTRSPVRSKGSWKEPDVLRFVGAAATTEVTTTLPPPNDHFTLQPGELRETWTDKDVLVVATEPVIIGQILVSQGFVDGALTGDPSLTIFPPIEQFRDNYLFLVPPSWTTNHVVIASPAGATVKIDGNDTSGCETTSIGPIDGTTWESRRCPLTEGVHKMNGSAPFGIIAYGYGPAGSYAFAGGADVKKIYEPPPLK